MAKFEDFLKKLKYLKDSVVVAPTRQNFTTRPIRATICAVAMAVGTLGTTWETASAAYNIAVPTYYYVLNKMPPTGTLVERMEGRWVSEAEPTRVLTITKDLNFVDSKINRGKLQEVGGHEGMYAFFYGGTPMCWMTFEPLSRNMMLLSNGMVPENKACITGLLKRVS